MSNHPVFCSATGIAFTTANDIAQLTVADDVPLWMCGLIIGQSSDLGDANEEVLRIGLYKGVTTGNTGGTALTVTKGHTRGPTPSVSGTCNWTNVSTGGTLVLAKDFNIRVGEEFWLPPEFRPSFAQGDSPISWRLLAAPADSVTLDITVAVLEL